MCYRLVCIGLRRAHFGIIWKAFKVDLSVHCIGFLKGEPCLRGIRSLQVKTEVARPVPERSVLPPTEAIDKACYQDFSIIRLDFLNTIRGLSSYVRSSNGVLDLHPSASSLHFFWEYSFLLFQFARMCLEQSRFVSELIRIQKAAINI